MECYVDVEDLKTLLLKCIGSKYPIRIKCENRDDVNFAYVRGFADPACSQLLIAKPRSATPYAIEVNEIRRIETFHEITLDRMRSRVFYLDVEH